MLSKLEIENIISEFQERGFDIKLRDIAYIVLSENIQDRRLSYKLIYGIQDYSDELHEKYDKGKLIKELRSRLKSKIKGKVVDVTFEENKAEIINLIKQTQEAYKAKLIEAKDALKIEADLRVKLNDKFNVQEDSNDQIVQVVTKFNAICECGKEIYIPTKEALMKEYDLVEKK